MFVLPGLAYWQGWKDEAMSEQISGLKAWKIETPCYDPVLTAAKSRDSVKRYTLEALRDDNPRPSWIQIRVTRAPEYDHLAERAYKEHLALGEIHGATGKVTIHEWAKRE
jgi:hypothetical protein